MPLLTLTIHGTDRTSFFQRNSLQVSDKLNSRNSCSFDIVDPAGAYRPTVGQVVTIVKGATTVFAGTIDDYEEEQLGNSALQYNIECVDYNQICDRHTVKEVYTSQTLRAIVLDIVATEMSTEGINTTNVETGPTIDKWIFNYETVTDAFNTLAELSGMSWWLDYSKNLHFRERASIGAPFALTDSSLNYRHVKIRRNREQYRNRQFIRAGKDLTDSRTESFKGDGTAQAYTLKFPPGTEPTVTVDGSTVAGDVGIRGVESGKDWYWNKYDPIFTQDDGATPLSSTQTLAVTYQGLFPVVVQADNEPEQISRAAVEGGSGLYEMVRDEPNIDDSDAAIQFAGGLLRRYATIPDIIEFETDADGLAAGQLISINVTAHSLAGTYLIESVSTKDVGMRSNIRYTVTALSGESFGGWIKFFRDLINQGRKFVVQDNEVLIKLKSFSDGVVVSDALVMSSSDGTAVVGTALCGFAWCA